MAETRDARAQLFEHWAVLKRRRGVIFLSVATITLTVLVSSFVMTPLYRSTATLQIERQNPDILTFQDLAQVDYSWAAYDDFYQTQYKILSSDRVSRLAADRLDLASHPAVQDRSGSPSLLTRLRSMVPGRGETTPTTPEDLATLWIQGGLEISPIRNSHLVQVSWVSADPSLASRVANAVADAFIQFNIESKYTTTDQATEFLVEQIAALKEEIREIEERLQDYGESKRIVSVDESNNITLRALSDVSERRTMAQTRLAELEAAYRTALESPIDALPEVLESDLIARLKQEYATYEAEYAEMSRQFKNDWPEMRTLKSKLDGARERLELETLEIGSQVVAAAEADYRNAKSEVENLGRLLAQQHEAAQGLKRDASGYATLMAEVDRKRETLNALMTRQNEMALSTRLKDLDATSSNITIVDHARPAKSPFRPNKKLNLALGLLMGLGIGIAMAFFLDYIHNTVSSPTEIEKLVGLPTLAVIPKHGSSSTSLPRVRRRQVASVVETVDLVAHRDGRAEAAEAFRELRTSILLSNPGHPPRQIAITSALPEEGKSATAINLAVVLAQLGGKILLVDADLRRPRLYRVFEVENRHGVSTLLAGQEEDPLKVIVATGVENLELIPSGPIPPNPSELLNSPVFAKVGSRFLEAGYDHVVYDSPPVLSVSDPVIVASVMDATIVVARANRTQRDSLRHAVERLSQSGSRPVGVVINDAHLDSNRYTRYRYYGRDEAVVAPEALEGGRSRRVDSA